MSNGNLRAAVIGYGLAGSVFHAPLIAAVPGLELAAVVTASPERAAAVTARYPAAAVLEHAGQVWAGGYDLVVVAAPNRAHVPLALAAVEAGLPVVVDKPVAATAADAARLAGRARERGVPVFPFHNRRWDGDFRTLSRLAGAGELGRVLRLESRFERWRPRVKASWKESTDPADAGGVLYDLGPHLVDQALTLLGPPVSVYAEIAVRRDGAATPDDVFLALRHPGGARSHLWMSATAAAPGPRFRVLGSAAAYVSAGLDGQEAALRDGGDPAAPGWGGNPPGLLGTDDTGMRPAPSLPGDYPAFYRGVAAALAGTAPPPVTLDDAITGLRVIEAAQESAASGAAVPLTAPDAH